MRLTPRLSKWDSTEGGEALGERVGGFGGGHGDLVFAVAVAQFDGAVVDVIAADHGDQRHADQLGILELDARRHLLANMQKLEISKKLKNL